jgi:outer membrane protein OmpA-like peptidoglycan-associated protein
MGVTSSQLSTRAFGAAKPTADNGTAAGRQMNRRVEIVFGSRAGDVASN